MTRTSPDSPAVFTGFLPSHESREGTALQCLLLAVIVVSCVLTIVSCARKQEPERPSSEQPQTEPLSFPDTPPGRAVADTLQNMFGAGPAAENRYQASLATLRSQPETVKLITEAYDKLQPAHYPSRWALVKTLADLKTGTTVEPLVRIAKSPVPPPEKGRDDILSPFEEETIIRMTAIQGLAQFVSARGEALEALQSLTRSEVPAIREEAARGLLSAARELREPEKSARLRELVPKELREIEPLKVEPVPPEGAKANLQPLKRGDKRPPQMREQRPK